MPLPFAGAICTGFPAFAKFAGTAFATKSWKYWGEGATAFGVRTLVETARRLGSA